jgi:hypothetical protein
MVPAGEHVLRVELPGHAPETRVVRGGEPMWLFVELLPLHMHTLPPTTGELPPPRPQWPSITITYPDAGDDTPPQWPR